MTDFSDVLKTALSLEIQDRAALAERLLASLDELSEKESEQLWSEVAEKRLQEIRAGRARTIPAGEVHAKAKRLLR
jgi:putative addiction module component (TIGR02574 family)